MSHRLALVALGLVLMVAACSDDDSADTNNGEETPTTAAAPDTAADDVVDTTGTDGAATDETETTSTEPVNGTTPELTAEPAPTSLLDSFTAKSSIVVVLGDNTVQIVTDGVHVGENFECNAEISVAGLNVAATVVATPASVWLDEGAGFEPVTMLEAEDFVTTCPVWPPFWDDFDLSDMPPGLTGTPDTVNGVPAQMIDFTEALELAAGMGLTEGLEGADFERFDIWIADDGRWIAGLEMDANLSAEAAAQVFGGPLFDEGGVASMSMEIHIADVNDPSLSIDIPEG